MTALTAAAEPVQASELVQFPAVRLPGASETVAVGETAEAILADAQPLEAAVAVADAAEAQSEVVLASAPKEDVSSKETPTTVTAEVAAQLESDLGQAIPVADVKEVELKPNTSYKVTFVEETKQVDVAQVVTLAAEPEIKAAVQQDDGSVKLEVDAKDNPAGTSYSIALVKPATGEILGYVDAATGALLKEGNERFQELKSTIIVVKNVGEDAELVTFVIQAQNQKGEATSWSEEKAIVPAADQTVDDSTEVAADDATLVDPAAVGINLATTTEKDVQAKVDANQANLSTQKSQLKELKGKLEQIRKELKARNGDRRDVQHKLKKLEKDAKKHAKEIEKLKGELEAVQVKIDQLGKQLRDVKAQITALQTKIKDQAATVKKLKKVLNQMQKATKEAAKKTKKAKK